MGASRLPANLSEDERKATLLALAHLASYLSTWAGYQRGIAGKIDPDGQALFDEFKELSAGGESIEEILESTR